jgi:WD40 repeat protein
VRVWRVSDGTQLRRFSSRKTTNLSAPTFTPDGKILAAIGDLDQLVCFDVATGKELDILPEVRATEGPLAFSPDGTTLTALAGSQTLHFWDRTTGKDLLAVPDAHQDSVGSIAFADTGKTLVSFSRDHTIRYWDLATGRPTRVVLHDGYPRSLAVLADGSLLAAGPDDSGRNARVWNPETGVTLHSWPLEVVEDQPLFDKILIAQDASCMIATRSDGTLQSWDLATGDERPVIRPKLVRGDGQDVDAHYTFFSRDGRSMAVASLKGTILVVDVPTGRVRFETSSAIRDPEYIGNVNHQTTLEFAPDDHSLAFVRQVYQSIKLPNGWSREVVPRESTIVWLDARTGQPRREIRVPGRPVWDPVFSPDGRLLAGVSSMREDGSVIRIFRLGDRREIQSIETPSRWITALAFTPDGKRIAAGLYDTSIVLWDVRRTD